MGKMDHMTIAKAPMLVMVCWALGGASAAAARDIFQKWMQMEGKGAQEMM